MAQIFAFKNTPCWSFKQRRDAKSTRSDQFLPANQSCSNRDAATTHHGDTFYTSFN